MAVVVGGSRCALGGPSPSKDYTETLGKGIDESEPHVVTSVFESRSGIAETEDE